MPTFLTGSLQAFVVNEASMQAANLAGVSRTKVYVAFLCLSLGLSTIPGGPRIPQMLWDLWQIGHDPVPTTGVVTRLDCRDHGHVDYTFQLAGKEIGGRRPLVADVRCQDLRVGQRIAVTYQRAMPQNNYAFGHAAPDGNPAMAEFWTAAGFWAVFVLVGPLFLVGVWTLFSKITSRLG